MYEALRENKVLSTTLACDPNVSFVVEACAGSGKTWLICSRILRFLVEGGRPSSVLALTFTNKAASEMQSRLKQFLLFLAVKPDEEVVEQLLSIGIKKNNIKNVLQRARSLYECILMETEQPVICTFHSWYSKILAMSPTQISIFSNISLVASSKEFQNKVWKNFLDTQENNVNGEDSEFMLLVETIGVRSIKTALCSLIPIRLEVEDIIKNQNLTPENDGIQQALKKCDFERKMWCDKNSEESNFLSHYFNQINDREIFTKLLIDLNSNNLTDIASCFLVKDKSSMHSRFIRKRDEKIWGEHAEEVKKRTLCFANSLALLFKNCEIIIHEARDVVLRSLAKSFFLSLDLYVSENKETDYSGLEFLAWKIISGTYGPYVQSRLDLHYDQILIDEFQDTSSSQWKILKYWLNSYITSESGVDTSSPKIFVVGDPKQSIYRFRGADPKIFYKAQEWLTKNFYAQKLETNKTRRCAQEIIKFMNLLFCKSTLLDYKNHRSYNQTRGKVFRLPIINNQVDISNKNKDRNWLLDPLGGRKSDLWKEEGEQIGKILLEIKKSVDDFTWGDVKILVRSRIHSKDISESLTNLQIPNISDSNLNLLDQQEIIDLVSLLRFLVEDTSDYTFVVLAKSNLFDIQDDELIWLKEYCDVTGTNNSLWENLVYFVKTNEKEIPKKFIKFVNYIKLSNEKLEFMPVHDFLQYIISSSLMKKNLEEKLNPFRFSKALSNIEKFIEFSLDVDFGKFPSLAKFLKYITQVAEYKDLEGLNIDHTDEFDAVSIQTLHSAKGLESRIIVLAGMSDLENYDKEGIKWFYSLDQDLESIVEISSFKTGDYLLPNQEKISVYEEKLIEQEKQNLLYVGVTRAKEILILSAVEQKNFTGSWYDLVSRYSSQHNFLKNSQAENAN